MSFARARIVYAGAQNPAEVGVIADGEVQRLASRIWDAREARAAIPDARDLSRELTGAESADVLRFPSYVPEMDCRVKWLRQVIAALLEKPREWPETLAIDAGVAFVLERELSPPAKFCGRDLACESRGPRVRGSAG